MENRYIRVMGSLALVIFPAAIRQEILNSHNEHPYESYVLTVQGVAQYI